MMFVLLNACEIVSQKFANNEITLEQAFERLEGIRDASKSAIDCEAITPAKKQTVEERIEIVKNRLTNPGQG